jgi:hypothetical protein
MSQRFERCDMAGTAFEDVNLAGATFTNVNMVGVTIQNANLQGMHIEDANIAGLTIFGFRIDGLINAELDRRDPERVRLRMRDLYDPANVREVMARLEALRDAFRARLRATPAALLSAQPGPGEWSALESVRHLLFSEDLYLNRFILQNDEPWNPYGLLSDFLRGWPGYEQVGMAPSDDLETILAAWDRVHAGTRIVVEQLTPERLRAPARNLEGGTQTVAQVLQLLASHDLDHIRQAEAAIAKVSERAQE